VKSRDRSSIRRTSRLLGCSLLNSAGFPEVQDCGTVANNRWTRTIVNSGLVGE